MYRYVKTLTPFLSALHLVPSALAVWERETALVSTPFGHTARTCIHTPFSPASGNHLDVPLSSFRFPLWSPEPQVPATGSHGRRGFGTHRPKTDCMYRSPPFPVLLRAFCTHDTPHTYVHSLSLTLLQSRLPRTLRSLLCLRLFEFPFPISWCNRTPYAAPELPGFTLFCFLDNSGIL